MINYKKKFYFPKSLLLPSTLYLNKGQAKVVLPKIVLMEILRDRILIFLLFITVHSWIDAPAGFIL